MKSFNFVDRKEIQLLGILKNSLLHQDHHQLKVLRQEESTISLLGFSKVSKERMTLSLLTMTTLLDRIRSSSVTLRISRRGNKMFTGNSINTRLLILSSKDLESKLTLFNLTNKTLSKKSKVWECRLAMSNKNRLYWMLISKESRLKTLNLFLRTDSLMVNA